MFKKYLHLLLLLCCLHSQAQTPPAGFVPERIMIHTDRQLYLSGETIWFRLMTFDARQNTLSDFSQTACLEMISREGTAIAQAKIDLKDGQGSGALEIPQGIRSGYYLLRCYTQAMRNGSEADFGKASLIILDPAQPLLRAGSISGEVQASQQQLAVVPEKYLDISIQTMPEAPAQRSRVSLEITTRDAEGQPVAAQLSVAVALRTPAPLAGQGLFQPGVQAAAQAIAAASSTLAYAPENKGMQLHGTVVNEESGRGIAGAEVYLAFPGKTALVYLDLTDAEGRFSFLLPRLYGLRQVVLQARTTQSVPLRIDLASEFHQAPAPDPAPFVLPEQWLPLAEATLVNAQIGQAYQAFERPPVYHTANPFDSVPFFGRPNKQYRLDDYTRFPLPEFFYEIVPFVMVKGKYGSEHLEVVTDMPSPSGATEPLLLVDGVPVFDQAAFLKINNKLIASAEIVTAPFWLNPLFFHGIVQLTSFEGDARCFRLPGSALRRSFLTLLPEKQFVNPDYTTGRDNRLPDFRNTLYWNPAVTTDAEGRATLEFFTSDTLGDFEIRVEGVTATGLAGSGRGSLQVVKEDR